MKQPLILIIAGGTGGHVMPALSVAAALKAQGIAVHWMGTRTGIESTLVEQQAIPLHYIEIQGLRGKGAMGWLLAPLRIVKALYQSIKIILKLKPNAVISMGGYVSGPGSIAAWLCRCPLVIHEQNAAPGLTNRLLAPFADQIMTGFPNVFPRQANKTKQTGNPVRDSIIDVDHISHQATTPARSLKLLILGGSLGASFFNEVIPKALAKFEPSVRPQVWHQAGTKHIEQARAAYQAHGVTGKVEPFIEDMASAYAWADCVICRAGALTVAELAAAGVASLLVPFPLAVDDHQTKNAYYLTNNGAAILLPQSQLSIETLVSLLQDFSENPQKLIEMGLKARLLAKPRATQEVVSIIRGLTSA